MTTILAVAAMLLAQLAAGRPDSTDLYYAGFLRPDPKRTKLSQEEGQRIQDAHMANIRRIAANGNLVSAGPFDDRPTTISEIFIIAAEEAMKAIDQSTAVKAGILRPDHDKMYSAQHVMLWAVEK
ncbi:MAG TPA: hypothetical protein VNH18_23755 [Bryobacteraceae bacterium]|nr:hypothetical protein [Bryobacteraceae bacterium]